MQRRGLGRRRFLQMAALAGAGALTSNRPRTLAAEPRESSVTALDIGSGLELAVDPRWIDWMDGLQLQQQTPVPREVIHEGPGGFGYLSVLKDGDLYRM